MKSPLVIAILVVAGLLVLAGIGYLLLRSLIPAELPPPEKPPNEQPAPPGDSKHTPEPPSPHLEQQLEDLNTAIAEVCATGKSQEATLVITETEVNDLAARLLAQSTVPEDIPLEVRSVSIDFKGDNRLVTEIEIAAYGFEVTAEAKAEVGVENGQPAVQITEVNFGLIPLPQSTKDSIAVYIKQEIDRFLSQVTETDSRCNGTIDIELKEISIQQTEMVVTVIIRPSG